MQGVPQQFPFEKDCAQFRHLPQLPGVELYHAHIDRYAFEPHTHAAFGIGTVVQGAERFRYRGAQHVAAPGSLVLMNPDELHTGESASEGGWNYRMIYLEPATLARLSGEQGLWFTDAVRDDAPAARRIAETLAALWQAQDPLAIDGLLLEAIAAFRPHAKVAQPQPREGAIRLDIVREYLWEHYAQPITLDGLAALVALSPYHFQRKFKAQFHVSPHQMLMAIRLYQAKRRLTQGMPAAQVAAAVGLTGPGAFDAGFRQSLRRHSSPLSKTSFLRLISAMAILIR
ncbi:Methylphosphotriester-DNA--protein-cysteine S-methyltransferase [Serratia odorifera]|uniref:Methylphosphotriester-DNA--protein-cysteine S-methyltransferase n=1 Tax=Serratia odorifera TaxID=618 RepID=A0A3S4EGP2_SEROD|nr:Methylphosphotriester-DNA--protein-cysteine S-methyltransferase [Serratia odorifera]